MTEYIYALKDPRTSDVRYVGHTNNPTRRLIEHSYIRGNMTDSRRKWLQELQNNNLLPIMNILETIEDKDNCSCVGADDYRSLVRFPHSHDYVEERELRWILYGHHQNRWRLLNVPDLYRTPYLNKQIMSLGLYPESNVPSDSWDNINFLTVTDTDDQEWLHFADYLGALHKTSRLKKIAKYLTSTLEGDKKTDCLGHSVLDYFIAVLREYFTFLTSTTAESQLLATIETVMSSYSQVPSLRLIEFLIRDIKGSLEKIDNEDEEEDLYA